jgi:hypothetical protein
MHQLGGTGKGEISSGTVKGTQLCGETIWFLVGYPKPLRKLPQLRDKQEVEFSGRILAGGSHEEITIYGKPDCWDIEGSR